MQNRFLPIYTPRGYKESDFSDIISDLKKRSSLDIEDGNITLRVFSKGEYFERFNKKFYIHIWSVLGEVGISVTEVTDDGIIQSLIRSLEEEVKKINKQLLETTVDRDRWLNQWIKSKQDYKNQKREIKKLLLSLGIEVKSGSELSKLLRIDNVPD